MAQILDRGYKGRKPRPQAYNTRVRRGTAAGPVAPPRDYNARVRRGTAAGPAAPKPRAKPDPHRSYNANIRSGAVAGPVAPRPSVNRSPDRQDARRAPAQKAHDAEVIARTVREMREKYLAEKGAGAGTRAIKRELEGRGQLAKLGKLYGRSLGMAVDPSQTWVKPAKGEVIDGTYVSRFANDAVNMAANAPSMVYLPQAAAVEAARGRPQRAKALLHTAAQTDPVYNTAAAGVELARGNRKAAASHLAKARKSASEHPGYLAAELYGGRGAFGRLGGGLIRQGARATGSERLSALGSTVREPKTLPGTELVEHRRYSKDITRAATQKAQDRQRARTADEYRQRAADEPNPERRAELHRRAREADPTIIRDRDINRRVDEHRAMAENVRRINQSKLLKTERKALKGAKKGGPVVSLLAQKITRPTLKSLGRYRDDLVQVQEKLRASDQKAKLRANEQLVHDLDQAIGKIKAGEVSLADLKEIADQYTTRNRALQKLLTTGKRAIYNPEQAERRALTPSAVRTHGVARDQELLKAREKAAGKAEKKAQKKAASSRGKLLAKQRAHGELTAQAIETLRTARPANRAILAEQERAAVAASKARQTQIKRATTSAKGKTAKAQTAAEAARAARALRRADPLLHNGREITTAELQAALEAEHGKGAQAAVVSQRPPQRKGGGDYFQSGASAPSGEAHKFSGQATAEGTADFSPDQLERQQVRTRTLADAFDTYKQFVDEFARRHETGAKKGQLLRTKNKKDADQLADDLSAQGDVQWTAIRLGPGGDQLRAMVDGTANEGSLIDSLKSGLSGEGSGPYAIIPKAAAKRMQEHLDVLNTGTRERGFRSLTSAFQRTVLATSLPWMVGNTGEATLRGALNRVGPGSYVTGRRFVKAQRQVDEDAAQRFEARTLGGGQGAFLDRTVHANLDNYTDGLVKDLTRVGLEVRGHPTVSWLPKAWDVFTHHSFNTINKSIEQFFQTGMLGRAVKEELMSASLEKATRQAVKEYAQDPQRGLSRNTAVQLGREIDKMYGRYEKFSPDTRRWIARYTPFGAWARNAVEFLGTLPERHPLTTATLGASGLATDSERKRLGLDIDLFHPAPNQLPLWLQGSIPDAHGGHYRLGRFTPFALAADPLGIAQGQVLPQFHSVLYAMNGLDWTGKPLKTKDGTEPGTAQRGLAALAAFIDATVPGVSLAKRIAEKGPASIPQSAVGYAPSGHRKSTGTGGGAAPKVKSSFGKSSFGKSSFGGSSFGKSSFK